MRITRQWLEPITLAGALALLGLLFEAGIFLVGAALVGALLVGAQLGFLRRVRVLRTSLTVELAADRDRLATEEPTRVTLDARAAERPRTRIDIRAALPPATQADGELAIDLDTHERASSAVTCSWPIAGTMTLSRPIATATDPFGWYTSGFPTGESLEITVHPARPERMHVGQGGETLPSAYGEHAGGPFDTGTTPGELREYVPGDAAARIDWKATARTGEVYVREFEPETDVETAIVLDHRATLDQGSAGATKLAYLRQFALAYLAQARDLGDPVGLFTVGEDGLTHQRWPTTRADQYERMRHILDSLGPTGNPDRGSAGTVSAVAAATLADRLEGTDMGAALAPFLRDRNRYVARIDAEPLFRTARLLAERSGRDRLTLILTDDTNRTEVHEAARVARRGDGRVLVFLTPSSLFEDPSIAAVEDTYRAYADFEDFRRRLDRMDRVRAYEIAPGDRLAHVLASNAGREVAS